MKSESIKERRIQIFASQKLGNGRVRRSDAPQSLMLQNSAPQSLVSQGLGLTQTRAFSVAEAMIALLIGSLILGYSAPMIAGQIKHNSMNDMQVQVLNSRIEELRRTQTNIPSGAVMYFDLGSCPAGWAELTSKYPNAANAFIRNQSGSGRALGSYQESAVPDLEGRAGLFNTRSRTRTGVFSDSTISNSWLGGGGSGDFMSLIFRASAHSSVYKPDVNEVRPNNIVLLACRKN